MKSVIWIVLLSIPFVPCLYSFPTKSVATLKCQTSNYVDYDDKLCLGVLYFRNKKVFNHSDAVNRCFADGATLIEFEDPRMEYLVLNRFLHRKYLNRVIEESQMDCVYFWVGSFGINSYEESITPDGPDAALCPAVKYCSGRKGVTKIQMPCFSSNNKSMVSGIICLQMVDKNGIPKTKKRPMAVTVTVVNKASGANLAVDYKLRSAENVTLNVTNLISVQDYTNPKVNAELSANYTNGTMREQFDSTTVNDETIQEDDGTFENITSLEAATKKSLIKDKIVSQSKLSHPSQRALLIVTSLLIVGLIIFAGLVVTVRYLLKVRKIREYKVAAHFCKSEIQSHEEKTSP